MNFKEKPYWLKGAFIGSIVSFIIFLPFLFLVAEDSFEQKQLDYYRFQLCESCGISRGLDCVINVCENEANKLYSKPNYANQDLSLEEFKNSFCSGHVDISHGSPEAFINGFCGYNRWRGYNYGSKPNIVGTFFEKHTLKEAFGSIGMLFGLKGYLVLILPILIGLIIGKIKSKKNE
jgi:hypothetical protein